MKDCREGLRLITLIFLFTYSLNSAQTAFNPACGQSTIDDTFDSDTVAQAKRFLVELKGAVTDADKKRLASMMDYPIIVAYGAGNKTVRRTVHNRSEFMTQYRSIVSLRVREAINAQSPECLFGNGQGIMIGKGEVWFRQQGDGSMKIVTINN